MTILGHHLPRPRGFASMDVGKQREIASRGGRAAHAQGTAHKFSPEEARLAGRKGGERVSGDRAYMASIGRRGGEARHARRLARASTTAAAANGSAPQGDTPTLNVEIVNLKAASNEDGLNEGAPTSTGHDEAINRRIA